MSNFQDGVPYDATDFNAEFAKYLQKSLNLSDVSDVAQVLSNLGIGAAGKLGVPIPINSGGTGATSLAAAQSALGISTSSTTNVLADYAALRTFSRSGENAIYLYGLNIAGLFIADASDTTSADNGGTIIVGADGTRWKRQHNGTVSILAFGCVPDATSASPTDNAPMMQSAINAAMAERFDLYVTGGDFHMGSQLEITGHLSMRSNVHCSFTWHGASTSGWHINNVNAATNGNLLANILELPNSYGPHANADTSIPGYGGSIDYTAITGTFLTITDSSWVKIRWNQVGCWSKGVQVESVNASSENVQIDFNVADCCVTGFSFVGSANGSVDSVQVRGNTHWGKFGHYFNGTNGAVSKIDIDIQSYFLDVPSGDLAYADGTNGNNIHIRCTGLVARNDPNSPSGSGTFKPYIISGNQSVHGEGGYWGLVNSSFELGAAPNDPGVMPTAGDVIRAHIMGHGTRFWAGYLHTGSAIALSQSQGESYFNGGSGSAALAKTIPVSMAVPSLAAGATTTFYFYHQGISQSYQVVSFNASAGTGPLHVQAVANGENVNREVLIYVKNFGTSTYSGGTIYGIIEMP